MHGIHFDSRSNTMMEIHHACYTIETESIKLIFLNPKSQVRKQKSENLVVTVVEENKNDENYHILQENLDTLKTMRLLNGKQLNIIELPMPDAVVYDDQRLPASYANFYIGNAAVVVPTYRCDKDDKALDILQGCFPDRRVIGIDSTDIIWGLGSFHCLSQQEPEV